jgi:transcriptional regulator with XRE-family HTH domain
MVDAKTFAKTLNDVIEKSGMTRREVAKKAKMPYTTLCRWTKDGLTRKSPKTAENLAELCKALDVQEEMLWSTRLKAVGAWSWLVDDAVRMSDRYTEWPFFGEPLRELKRRCVIGWAVEQVIKERPENNFRMLLGLAEEWQLETEKEYYERLIGRLDAHLLHTKLTEHDDKELDRLREEVTKRSQDVILDQAARSVAEVVQMSFLPPPDHPQTFEKWLRMVHPQLWDRIVDDPFIPFDAATECDQLFHFCDSGREVLAELEKRHGSSSSLASLIEEYVQSAGASPVEEPPNDAGGLVVWLQKHRARLWGQLVEQMDGSVVDEKKKTVEIMPPEERVEEIVGDLLLSKKMSGVEAVRKLETSVKQ